MMKSLSTPNPCLSRFAIACVGQAKLSYDHRPIAWFFRTRNLRLCDPQSITLATMHFK